MTRKLESNIYGIDDNSFAHSISTAALGAPDSDQYSGAPIDESARSKDGADERGDNSRKYDDRRMSGGGTEPGEVVIKHSGGDSRATTKGNHGSQS